MKRKYHLIWLLGSVILVSLGSRWYSSGEWSPRTKEPSSRFGLSLAYKAFDNIRRLSPLTGDGRVLESTAPESYHSGNARKDASVSDEREEYALLWQSWDRDFQTGRQAYRAGKFEEALGFFEKSLQEARKVQHPDWRIRASESLTGVAQSYGKTGKPEKCLHSYRQAVQMLEEMAAPARLSIDLESAYRKLASELQRQHKSEESVEAYFQALSLHEENRCGLSPDVTKVDLLFQISISYSDANHSDQALSYLQKAEDTYRTSYFAPGMHWDVPVYALKLGREYRRLGEPKKAVDMFEYGLNAWAQLQGAPPEDRENLQAELEYLQDFRAQP